MQRPPERLPRLDPRIRVRDLKVGAKDPDNPSAYIDISRAPLLPSAISHTLEHQDVKYHFYRDYKDKLGVLGSGAFGEVRLAQNAATGEWVAIKRFVRESDPAIDPTSTVLGVDTLNQLIQLEIDLLEEFKKHKSFSVITLAPFIRELTSLKTNIGFLRKKMPLESEDLEQLQLALQTLIKSIRAYLRPICKSTDLQLDKQVQELYEKHKTISMRIGHEQHYLNAFENELRNLKSLGEYLFHVEKDGESYIGLKLYEGHRLSDFLPPTRNIQKPIMPGMPRHVAAVEAAAAKQQSPRVKLSKRQKYFVISRLLDAVRAMHAGELRGSAAGEASKDHSIIHRDLKPSNLIVDDQLEVHVVDKGLACSIDPNGGVYTVARVGTKAYMAPECLTELDGEYRYSAKSDMFSVGKVLARLLDIARVEVDERGRSKAIYLESIDYRKVTDMLYQFIKKLQAVDMQDRPFAKEALEEFEAYRHMMAEMMDADGFCCYTIRLSDLNRLVRDHTMKAFAEALADMGATSVAFIRDTDAVKQGDILRMMRKLRNVGIMHFAPEVYLDEQAYLAPQIHQGEPVLDKVSRYYKSLFILDRNPIRSSCHIAKGLRVHTHLNHAAAFRQIPEPEDRRRVAAGKHRAKAATKAIQGNDNSNSK